MPEGDRKWESAWGTVKQGLAAKCPMERTTTSLMEGNTQCLGLGKQARMGGGQQSLYRERSDL